MTENVDSRLGELYGRVGGLEGRMDRHEILVAQRIQGLETNTSSMNGKLDTIGEQMAESRGAAKTRDLMLKALLLLAALSSAGAAIYGVWHAWGPK